MKYGELLTGILLGLFGGVVLGLYVKDKNVEYCRFRKRYIKLEQNNKRWN